MICIPERHLPTPGQCGHRVDTRDAVEYCEEVRELLTYKSRSRRSRSSVVVVIVVVVVVVRVHP